MFPFFSTFFYTLPVFFYVNRRLLYRYSTIKKLEIFNILCHILLLNRAPRAGHQPKVSGPGVLFFIHLLSVGPYDCW